MKESGTKKRNSGTRIHVTGLWFIATLLPNDSTIQRLRLEGEAPITSKLYSSLAIQYNVPYSEQVLLWKGVPFNLCSIGRDRDVQYFSI